MNAMLPDEKIVLAVDELRRILNSEQFTNAPIVRAFLEFVVTETLHGRGARLKAYTIAVEGFGRSPGFDPSSDTIVRTTAGRVRKALQAYYQTSETAPLVIISLPKGGYTPTFSIPDAPRQPNPAMPSPCLSARIAPEPDAPEPGAAALSLSTRGRAFHRGILLAACGLPVIAFSLMAFPGWRQKAAPIPEHLIIDVQPVEYAGEQARLLAREIDIRLAPALSRIKLAEVIPPGASGEMAGRVPTTKNDPGNSIVFDLAGSITNGATPELIWKLKDTASNRILWSSRENLSELTATSINAAIDKIAFQILGTGAAASSTFERYRGNFLSRPTCLFRAQIDEIIANDIAYLKIRECLEKIVNSNPKDAATWAVLSNLYTVRSLYYLKGDRKQRALLIEHADQAAQKAAELAPESYLTKIALMRLSLRQGKIAEFDALQREIRKNYPGDIYSQIRIADRLARLRRSGEALEIFNRARHDFGINLKNWAPPITIAYFAEGDYVQAYREMLQITSDLRFALVLKIAVLGKLDKTTEAAPVIRKLMETNPDIKTTFYPWLNEIGWDKQLVRDIGDGLAKAGLVVDPAADIGVGGAPPGPPGDQTASRTSGNLD